jgi:hypothetical protein
MRDGIMYLARLRLRSDANRVARSSRLLLGMLQPDGRLGIMLKQSLFATATAVAVSLGAIAATSTPAAARPYFGFYFGGPCCYYQPYYYNYYQPYYYRPYYYRPYYYNYYNNYPRYNYRPYYYRRDYDNRYYNRY